MSDSKLLARLGSLRFAAWLIVVFMVMIVVSFIVPQKGFLGVGYAAFAEGNPAFASVVAALSLDRIYTSWIMVVFTVLLVINVSACTLRRLLRRSVVPRPSVGRGARSAPLARDAQVYVSEVDEFVAARGWKVVAREDEGLVARAGASGFWGSMVLHVSLLILIIGGLVTGMTAFRGRMTITDGQTVIDSTEAYDRIEQLPRFGPEFTGARITLDSTEFGYEDGQIVRAVANMRGIDRQGRLVTHDVRVNYPLEVGGRSYLLLDSGFAVALTVTLPDGTADSRVVRLGEKRADGWVDALDLPPVDGKPARLVLRATPVPVSEGATMPAEQFVLTEPTLYATVEVGGEPVWSGQLAEGQTLSADTGHKIAFEDLVFWDFFRVSGEPYRWVTYVGFWLAVVGAGWRFLVPERRLSVVVREVDDVSTAHVSHRARPWAGFEADRDRTLVGNLLELATASGTVADAEPSGEDS